MKKLVCALLSQLLICSIGLAMHSNTWPRRGNRVTEEFDTLIEAMAKADEQEKQVRVRYTNWESFAAFQSSVNDQLVQQIADLIKINKDLMQEIKMLKLAQTDKRAE
jgi:hypothetical protein